MRNCPIGGNEAALVKNFGVITGSLKKVDFTGCEIQAPNLELNGADVVKIAIGLKNVEEAYLGGEAPLDGNHVSSLAIGHIHHCFQYLLRGPGSTLAGSGLEGPSGPGRRLLQAVLAGLCVLECALLGASWTLLGSGTGLSS